MSETQYLSPEGYENLKAELDQLKNRWPLQRRQAIAEAREKGDLSENAEYDAAKDAQGMLEMKIHGLEKVMANARRARLQPTRYQFRDRNEYRHYQEREE